MATTASHWKPAALPLLTAAARFLRSPNAALRLAKFKTTSTSLFNRTAPIRRAVMSSPYYSKARRVIKSPLFQAANIAGNVGGALYTGYDISRRYINRKAKKSSTTF